MTIPTRDPLGPRRSAGSRISEVVIVMTGDRSDVPGASAWVYQSRRVGLVRERAEPDSRRRCARCGCGAFTFVLTEEGHGLCVACYRNMPHQV